MPAADPRSRSPRARRSSQFSVIDRGGAADRAGIHSGDVILTVEGADVTKLTPMGVLFVIGQHPIGSTVHLGLGRGAQTVAASLVLSAQ